MRSRRGPCFALVGRHARHGPCFALEARPSSAHGTPARGGGDGRRTEEEERIQRIRVSLTSGPHASGGHVSVQRGETA